MQRVQTLQMPVGVQTMMQLLRLQSVLHSHAMRKLWLLSVWPSASS